MRPEAGDARDEAADASAGEHGPGVVDAFGKGVVVTFEGLFDDIDDDVEVDKEEEVRLSLSLVLKLSKSGCRSGVWSPFPLSLDHIWKSGFHLGLGCRGKKRDNLSTKKRQICSNTSQEHRAYLIWSRLRRKSGPYMV